MNEVTFVLFIVGIIFLVGSFMVQEKLSKKDMDQLSKLSDKELKIIIGKKIENAKAEIEDAIDETIEASRETTLREMEKTTNEKIMAISEFSDTIVDTMNQTHNEIMFLYSMLNDKQKDITELTGTLQRLTEQIRTGKYNQPVKKQPEKPVENQAQDFARQQNQSQAMATEMYFKSAREVSGSQTKNSSVEPAVNTSNVSPILNSPIPAGSALSKEGLYKGNKNEDILRLHKEGKSDVEIAKELNCGLGEVKLVLGLYKGDNNSEI